MPKRKSRATISDVARLARVSIATVSIISSGRRNGADRISAKTRERVLRAVAKLGYAPDQTARNLRRRRTERICLMVSQLGVPYHDMLAEALQVAADQHGYHMVIVVGGSAERERQVIQQLQRGLADGIVMMNPHHVDAEDLARLARANVAVTVIGNQIVGDNFDTVQTNESEVCRQALDYLVGKGHRQIAFLGSIAERLSHQQRYQVYVQALENHQIPISEDFIQGDAGSSREKAYQSVCTLMQMPDRPTAIFAASDIAAVSAIWAIRDAGLRVPEDVAVIGVGNIPEGGITRPPLTTVGPASSDWKPLTDMLFSRLNSARPLGGRVHISQWALIQRGSA